MKKVCLGLALAGVLIGTGVVGTSHSVSANTSIVDNHAQRNEEVNLVKNGDFSDGGNHWLVNGDRTPDFPDGYGVVDEYFPLFSDRFEVEPGTKYKFQFDVKKSNIFVPDLEVELLNEGNSVKFSTSVAADDNWTTYSYEYTTPDYGVKTLSLWLGQKISMAQAYIDNVKFVKVAD